MCELGLGMFVEVLLQLLPVAFIVANRLTVRTNREQTAKHLDFGEGIL